MADWNKDAAIGTLVGLGSRWDGNERVTTIASMTATQYVLATGQRVMRRTGKMLSSESYVRILTPDEAAQVAERTEKRRLVRALAGRDWDALPIETLRYVAGLTATTADRAGESPTDRGES